MTLLSILLIGFLLGMKHALESDHLAAVASLATRQHSFLSTLRQGIAWGVGHTVTLMLVGGVVLALGTAIPEKLERALELCVGVMLVGLGIDVIRKTLRQRIHFHVHRHGTGEVHIHAHSHAGSSGGHREATPVAMRLPNIARHQAMNLPVIDLEFDHSKSPHEHEHLRPLPLRALAVGMMHGLAGSAALILLSLQTVRSGLLGVGYIFMFGVGSVAGMATLSMVIAIPLRLSGKYLTGLYRSFTTVIGVVTLGLGALIVYRIGFIEGLLTS